MCLPTPAARLARISCICIPFCDGARRDRTADLLLAEHPACTEREARNANVHVVFRTSRPLAARVRLCVDCHRYAAITAKLPKGRRFANASSDRGAGTTSMARVCGHALLAETSPANRASWPPVISDA
jgi:hypothetical protein